jgi:hypothetical protein
MKHTLHAGLLALVFATPAARAEIYIAPLPERLARADCAAVGKVVEIEKQPVRALPSPGAPQRVEYQVAVVKLSEVFVGEKGVTHIRVGFFANDQDRRRPSLPANFKEGFEGCFLVGKHHEEPIYVPSGYGAIVARTDDFEAHMKPVRRCAALLADPNAGLESKDADDRLLTAAMLVTRYRVPGGLPEPIPAAESKLILTSLRDADWSKPVLELLPYGPFSRLGLTGADGWQPGNDAQNAARAWLNKNAETYRIQRLAPAKKK